MTKLIIRSSSANGLIFYRNSKDDRDSRRFTYDLMSFIAINSKYACEYYLVSSTGWVTCQR